MCMSCVHGTMYANPGKHQSVKFVTSFVRRSLHNGLEYEIGSVFCVSVFIFFYAALY